MTPRNGRSDDPEPLLPRIARGDSKAVQSFVDHYGALVWSLVRKSIRDHSQAEDAVQEIFISLWKNAARFDADRGSESLFVTTVARRRLIDRFRSQARHADVESIDGLEVPDPDRALERVETSDEADLAIRALEQLKPGQKRLLEMWFVGGMTHTEIATSTGMPLGTVKSQIRRGILRVRELLQSSTPSASAEVTA